MHPVFAQSPAPAPAATSNSGSGFSWLTGAGAGFLAQLPLLIWYVLMYIAQMILVWILSMISFFMNNIFFYNVILNPNNMPVVVEGWAYLRDIANGLFILIVLWIALTIIFDIEQLGGKKLLFRVITVALLINFSLALVSVTFGLANQMALPFYNVIKKANGGDLAALIISRTNLHSIFDSVSQNTATAAKNVALGIDPPKQCGFSALAPNADANLGMGCLGADSLAGSFAESFTQGFTSGANALGTSGILNLAIAMGVSLIFLSAVIAAFIGISAILLIRIIMMVFLGVTAPVAFISHVIPGGKLNKIWNMWLEKLFCWSFVSPAFYFLFYVSLRILMVMTDTPITTVTNKVGILGNLLNFIPFVVFMGFLWASIKVGRWMGCTALGEVGVEWSKKLGRAAVVGTAQLAGTAVTGGANLIAGRVAGTVATAAQGMARSSSIGKIIAGPALRGSAVLLKQQKSAVNTAKEDFKDATPENIAAQMRNQLIPNAASIIAGTKALTERNKITLLSDQEQRNAVSLARRIGEERDILLARPDLALNIPKTEKITFNTNLNDLNTFVDKIKPKDIAKIDFTAIGQERDASEKELLRQRILRRMTETGNDNHLAELSNTMMDMPKKDRKVVLDSWKAVLGDRTHWQQIETEDPTRYNNYIRYIAGKAGRRLIDKDELPDFIKAKAKDLDVEGFRPPKQGRERGSGRQQGGGVQNQPVQAGGGSPVQGPQSLPIQGQQNQPPQGSQPYGLAPAAQAQLRSASPETGNVLGSSQLITRTVPRGNTSQEENRTPVGFIQNQPQPQKAPNGTPIPQQNNRRAGFIQPETPPTQQSNLRNVSPETGNLLGSSQVITRAVPRNTEPAGFIRNSNQQNQNPLQRAPAERDEDWEVESTPKREEEGEEFRNNDEDEEETYIPRAIAPNTGAPSSGIINRLEQELRQTRQQERDVIQGITQQENRVKSKYGSLDNASLPEDERAYLNSLYERRSQLLQKHNDVENNIASQDSNFKIPGTVSSHASGQRRASYADTPSFLSSETGELVTHDRNIKLLLIQERKKDEISRLHEKLLQKEAAALRARLTQLQNEHEDIETLKEG